MIRPAHPDEADALQAVAEAAYAPYVADIGRRPAPMDADFNTHIIQQQAWVATDAADRVIGYVILIPEAECLWIDNIAIEPGHQGRGAGRALLLCAEQEARQRGSKTLDLYTNAKMGKNLALYRRAGFREVGRRVQNGFDRVFFQKDIGPA